MDEIKFEWDENKNAINIKKHGVSFEDVESVFYDDCALLFDDPEHSKDEDRFLIIGYPDNGNLCIVSHCYRKHGVIRIISARRATHKEQLFYHEYNGG